MMPKGSVLRRRAIRIVQHTKHPLYLFALSAEELLNIADISRVGRDDTGHLLGYQRPEVKRHVKNIVEYLDSDEVLFPNSVILALSSSCTFKQVRGPKVDEGPTEAGTLEIPLPKEGETKPAWIVDGQQRALALSHAKRQDFPVPINAFIADEVELQRDQFLRVNNTKPLPKGLITELLPEVDTVLPPNMAARKTPSALCDVLNRDPESPFFGLIRRTSMPPSERKKAVVTDSSLVKVLQDSFASPSGCLFPYRNSATNVTDFDSIRRLLFMYWGAVRDVFPQAWALPPEKSRLMHSIGILAMGRLMDRVMGSVSLKNPKAPAQVRADIARIKSFCRWIEGHWDELDADWNELQNVPRHVRGLTEFLLRTYLSEGEDGRMKFFFPDSQDLVDPSFDFERERRSIDRLRQRDDLYAHEVFSAPAFDGLLVSKGIVDGFGSTGSRYSIAQRQRLLRLGTPEFFRVVDRKPKLPILGDCGAFTYVKEPEPPYSVEDLLEFYEQCQFDFGISLDHVILDYKPEWDERLVHEPALDAARDRQALTLELAGKFLKLHKKGGLRFQPMGVAQGWSPKSYAASVKQLQKMGYTYIALGGMVPLKSPDILASLKAADTVREKKTKLHLLGVTRTDHIAQFAKYGVQSFDSTSPLRQAFKDDVDNYYSPQGAYTAVRVPQVEGNPKLAKGIRAGVVAHDEARRLEKAALGAMSDYAKRKRTLEATLSVICEYERLYDPKGPGHEAAYRKTLADRPWDDCVCDVCKALGHHVILFRGAERNRRRGFHNLWVFYRTVKRELGLTVANAA